MSSERHVSKGQLEKLLGASERCQTSCEDARFKVKVEIEKAKASGLNPWAFGIVKQLWKQDASKAAHNIRALKLYIDHLGLEAQADLEDVINDLDVDEDEDEDVAIPEAVH